MEINWDIESVDANIDVMEIQFGALQCLKGSLPVYEGGLQGCRTGTFHQGL